MSVVKLRGLPWSITKADIINFFKDTNILNGENGIHLLINKKGRLSGEAFIEFENKFDLETALKRNKSLMGQRYIEIFRSTVEKMNENIDESNRYLKTWNETCVRLRGLPFGCTKYEIIQFFQGLALEYKDILMVTGFTGQFNGEAFVCFHSLEDAITALDFHKKKIGHRYIEVFPSCQKEMKRYEINSKLSLQLNTSIQSAKKVPLGNTNEIKADYERECSFEDGIDQNDMFTNHTVKMRGLPFNSKIVDIKEFFKPLQTCSITLFYNSNGRFSGDVEVNFKTHSDACEAMKNDRKFIRKRYIELFLLSGSNMHLQPKSNQFCLSNINTQDAECKKNNFSKFDCYILKPHYSKAFY